METLEKKSGISEIASVNKALIKRFYNKVYVDWNMEFADQVLSPQFISHDWPMDSSAGPHAFREYYRVLRSALPDARYEVDDIIAENDRVVVRWRLLGTHNGDYMGIAASGRTITLSGIAIYRLENGCIMERWVVSDLHGVLEQIHGSSPAGDIKQLSN
jgi:steroid delta-isomerase-like uncharacterized protein